MPHARVPHGSYVIVTGRNRPLKEGLDTNATRPHSLLLSGNACAPQAATGCSQRACHRFARLPK